MHPGAHKLIFSLVLLAVMAAGPVLAGENLNNWKTNLDKAAGPDAAGYAIAADPDNQINVMIGKVIQAFLSFLGVIFLVLMIYGGYLWMTARGNETQLTKAKDVMTAAVIGLIIVLIAYAISHFVVKEITNQTLTG